MKKEIITYLPIGILTGVTMVSGAILSGSSAGAVVNATCTTDSTTGRRTCTNANTASVTVGSACGYTNATSTNTINLESDAGLIVTTESDNTKPSMTISCNDAGGFKIYAVGNSPATAGGEATLGQTHLISASGSINTGTGTSGLTSAWAYKVTSATSNSTVTNHNGNAYAEIPSEYSKIVSVAGLNDEAATATVRTDYRIYLSPIQAADTYVGGVVYKLVHPTTAADPSIND